MVKTPAAHSRMSLVVQVLKDAGMIDLRGVSSKEVVLNVPAGAGANGLRLVAFLEESRIGAYPRRCRAKAVTRRIATRDYSGQFGATV